MRAATLLLVLVLLLAGCASRPPAPTPPTTADDGARGPSGAALAAPPSATPATFSREAPAPTLPLPADFVEPYGPRSFRGTFTHDATEEDVHAACVAARGSEPCSLLTSAPLQYWFGYPSLETCEEARAKVLAVRNVAGVTRCAGDPEHRLWAMLRDDATWADVGDVEDLVREVGGHVDGAGPQDAPWRIFLADSFDAADCARLEAALRGHAYVAQLQDCHEMPPELPPTGTEPAPEHAGRWSYHGHFMALGMSGDTAAAVCEASGIRASDCAMPQPWPPQFGFSFDSPEKCEAARDKVLEVPHVTGVRVCQRGHPWV